MARFERASVIDLDELEILADSAFRGNEAAEETIRDLNEIYSRRASQRMRELEGKKVTTNALQYAQHYLDQRDRRRFGAGRSADIDEVVENLKQARKFLTFQTSTLGGERSRIEKMLDTMQKHSFIGEFETAQDRKTFLNFLSSDAFKDYKKAIGSGIIADAKNAIESGASLKSLETAYQQYQSGSIGAIESWENWTKL